MPQDPSIKPLVIFGEPDEGTLTQIKTCLGFGGEYAVLCADNHKGYAQPIGGVVAYQDAVSVSGVGYDIGCGNLAVKTDLKYHDLKWDFPKLLKEISTTISFGVGRVNDEKVDHPIFNNDVWDLPIIKGFKDTARAQLGTVGSGNHYVDIFVEDNFDRTVWVGVHFGSRGFGHRTATAFLKAAEFKDGMDVEPCVLSLNSTIGQDYMEAMTLAGSYAYAGRKWVVNKVLEILGALNLDSIHNHHNYAWKEHHFGSNWWVVRKGATPAFPGQRGFVGGSMGDNAVILEGKDSQMSKNALYSTVHGAGRVMSRTQAKGKYVKNAEGKKIRGQGLIRHDEWQKWLKEKGVTLIGGDLDEAPQAYRRLDEVLKYHAETVNILHTLEPWGVIMAGYDVKDPYKD